MDGAGNKRKIKELIDQQKNAAFFLWNKKQLNQNAKSRWGDRNRFNDGNESEKPNTRKLMVRKTIYVNQHGLNED